MAGSADGIITLLRLLTVLVILATLATLFVYSPYYSQSVLWLLHKTVPVQIDPVAAKSQTIGELNLDSGLEPGSAEWVARSAYLYEVNQALKLGSVEAFVDLQLRYQQLLDQIEEDKKNLIFNHSKDAQLNQDLVHQEENIYLQSNLDKIHLYQENEPLFQQYREFLRKDENLLEVKIDDNVRDEMIDTEPRLIFKRPYDQPHAIIILGGGLTTGQKKGEIVVNAYTQKRLEKAVELYKEYRLPILLSGVEAPYMQKWLEKYDIKAHFSENKSMNTCENTRFSSLLLQKQGGAPTVYLVTDAYHMPRSQRLFANNGISTLAVNAPLPNPLTNWKPDSINLMHSRRATYELLATFRDLWFGESNCREIP